jgi:ribonuclease PH
MVEDGRLSADPVIRQVAAVSVGVVAGEPVLDLDYQEDSGAAVDMNVVMDDRGGYIELQGTAEASPYSSDHLAKMLALAGDGIRRLMEAQRRALG